MQTQQAAQETSHSACRSRICVWAQPIGNITYSQRFALGLVITPSQVIKEGLHRLAGFIISQGKVKAMPLSEFSKVENAPVAASEERTHARVILQLGRKYAIANMPVTFLRRPLTFLPASLLLFFRPAPMNHIWCRDGAAWLFVSSETPLFFSHRPELADKRKRVSGRAGSRPRRVLAVTVLFLTPPHACCPVGYQCGWSGFLRCSASLWRLAAEMRSAPLCLYMC